MSKMTRILLLFLLLVKMVSSGNIDTDVDDDEEEETESVLQDEGESEDEEETEEKKEAEVTGDLEWVSSAVKDVAYYLRIHKFNDFDRRYHAFENKAPKDLFKEFPDPPLRSLHWEVRKHCEPGFLECLQYLHEKVQRAELRRDIDTVYAKQGDSSRSIEDVDRECQRFRRLDWIGAQPFLGPLERFQWRTTASYYMCWFTMHEEPALSFFGERCDNFANCLDPEFQDSNGDPRASDNVSFQCSTYSFCPDPCCPRKHYHNMEDCYLADSNPCHSESPLNQHQCTFNRSRNIDFVAIVLNRWNVTCTCKEPGYQWDSRFGICVDIDECIQGFHECNVVSEACFNLPGSYICGCQWGFWFDANLQECVRSDMFLAVKSEEEEEMLAIEEGKPVSIKFILRRMFKKQLADSGNKLIKTTAVLFCSVTIYLYQICLFVINNISV